MNFANFLQKILKALKGKRFLRPYLLKVPMSIRLYQQRYPVHKSERMAANVQMCTLSEIFQLHPQKQRISVRVQTRIPARRRHLCQHK